MNINFHKICICVLTVCYLPVLFLGLFDLDEGAFAATSLQMIKQNQYILPFIGEELRLEKPILTYWIQVCGRSEREKDLTLFYRTRNFYVISPKPIKGSTWSI